MLHELFFYRYTYLVFSLVLVLAISAFRFGFLEPLIRRRKAKDPGNIHLTNLLLRVDDEYSHSRSMIILCLPDLAILTWLVTKASNLFIDRYISYAEQKSLTDKEIN
jgi:hypothetical protein